MPPAAAIPTETPHRPRGTPKRRGRGRTRALVLIGVHGVILAHVAHWQIAGTTLTPLEPSEAMQTLELGYVNAGFLLLCATILATLVLGRFFCGWACHVVAYQDLCAWLLGRVGLRPRPLRSRLLALLPFAAAFAMFVWPSLARAWRGEAAPGLVLHLTTDSFWRTFPGPWIAALTLLVDGFLVVWWLGAKGFCTYGCPYGALYGLADRLAPGRIRVSDACDGSAQCTAACTSNVRVHEEVARFGMVVDTNCLKCLDCVAACPNGALRVGFGLPPLVQRAARPRRRYDFTWPQELALAALCVAALLSLRGLYHKVPFLLALGLAVLVASAGAVAWRMLREPELRVQHVQVKRGGRLTGAGRALAAGIALLLLFTAHSGVVRHAEVRGEVLFVQANAERGPARAATLSAAEPWLLRAERLGLFPDGALQAQLGSLARERGAYAEAEARLRRATELAPELAYAWIGLADLQVRRGARDDAVLTLRRVLDREPGFAPARERLERLGR